MSTTPNRHLPLDTIYNLRDIGGLPATDGRTIRWRTLLRSDSTHLLTPPAQDAVITEGVRTVIDLRFGEDLVDEPDPFTHRPDVAYCHLPLYEKVGGEGLFSSLEDLFCRMADHNGDAINRVLHKLLEPDTLPALVHCTGGKDRTGVVMALAELAVGVPEASVIEDFAVSADYLRPNMDFRRRRLVSRGWAPERAAWFLESPPEAMERFLRHLDSRYGGPQAYLDSIGFGAEARAALAERLLTIS